MCVYRRLRVSQLRSLADVFSLRIRQLSSCPESISLLPNDVKCMPNLSRQHLRLYKCLFDVFSLPCQLSVSRGFFVVYLCCRLLPKRLGLHTVLLAVPR